MDQGGGLKRLARLLLGQPLSRQFPKLVVNKGQELIGSLGVALLDGRQNLGDFTHGDTGRAKVAAQPPSPASGARLGHQATYVSHLA
jgi:hypothetical protein